MRGGVCSSRLRFFYTFLFYYYYIVYVFHCWFFIYFVRLLQNRGMGLDMNVREAWAEGVTGKGTVVTILDDGLEKDHPDIRRNYVRQQKRERIQVARPFFLNDQKKPTLLLSLIASLFTGSLGQL